LRTGQKRTHDHTFDCWERWVETTLKDAIVPELASDALTLADADLATSPTSQPVSSTDITLTVEASEPEAQTLTAQQSADLALASGEDASQGTTLGTATASAETVSFIERGSGLVQPDEPATTAPRDYLDHGLVTPVVPTAAAGAQAVQTAELDTAPATSGPVALLADDDGCAACNFPLVSDVLAGTTSSTTSASKPVGTIPQLADYLVNGFWQWNGMIAHHWATNTISYNISGLNAAEQALAQSALTAWHEVANLTFVQTSGAANITYYDDNSMRAYEQDNGGVGSSIMTWAQVHISSNWVTTDGGAYDGKTGVDSYAYQTYIHETGHALGLGHQGPYNGSATYFANAIYANDTWQYSVMSYFSQDNYSGSSYRYVVTPEMSDIYAVDSIYGAATGTRTGNTVYGFNNTAGSIYNFASYSQAPALTIYDSGGNDTLDASGYSAPQVFDIAPGHFSSIGGLVGNIGIAANTTITKAIGGSGNDTFYASAGTHTFDGGGGSNSTIFTGARSQYLITQNVDGSLTIADQRSGTPDGTTTDVNMQSFQFADTTYTYAGLVATLKNIAVSGTSSQALEHGSAGTLLSGAPTITDSSSATIASATVQIASGSGAAVAGDQLFINGQQSGAVSSGAVSVSWNATTHTLTLTGSASIATYQSLLAQVTYQDTGTDTSSGSHPLRTVTWTVNDGSTSFNTTSQIGIDRAPTTVADSSAVIAGSTVSVASGSGVLVNDTDLDRDALTLTGVSNATSGAGTLGQSLTGAYGHLTLNANGSYSYVADIASAISAAASGSHPQDVFTYTESDGHGGTTTGQLSILTERAPVVTVSNMTAPSGQTLLAASTLFSFADPDADAATTYAFWESASSSGHFVLNGIAQADGTTTQISASQLANLYYQTGSSADQIYIRANDGQLWSSPDSLWANFTLTPSTTTPPPPATNQPPVVTVADMTAPSGQTLLAASSLFSYSDADGQAAMTYQFWESASSTGHFVLNGVAQADGMTVQISASQLSSLSYQTGSSADVLYIRAYDGSAWSSPDSSWTHFTLTPSGVTPPSVNQPPVVTVSDMTAPSGQTLLAASSLFSYSDADGEAAVTYQFWESGSSTGHFVLNGVGQADGVTTQISAAQLSSLYYKTGSSADVIYVRAYDGHAWSSPDDVWTHFTLTPSTFQPTADAELKISAAPQAPAATIDPSADAFIFTQNQGTQTISGFHAGTDIVNVDHNLFANAAAVMSHISDDGRGNAVIAADSHDVLVLQNVVATSLHQTDFHIV